MSPCWPPTFVARFSRWRRRRWCGVAEFDRYQGKGVAEGRVSLSYRLTFQAPDRTLTDAEADAAMATIVDALTARTRRGQAVG